MMVSDGFFICQYTRVNRLNGITVDPTRDLFDTDFHRPFKSTNLPLTKFEQIMGLSII